MRNDAQQVEHDILMGTTGLPHESYGLVPQNMPSKKKGAPEWRRLS